jgi:transcriptional regulator of acetoin/glycerol metabolism
MTDPNQTAAGADDASAPRSADKTVEWIDRDMATHFANVVNVQSTREQVDLFFGTNRTWNVSETPRVAVDLSNRVILTPHAAKRLWAVLGGVLREYEQRYGVLTVDRS